MVMDYFGRVPLLFEPAVNGGIPILIDNPSEVGADRVVNSIAAFAAYGGKGLPIIVDRLRYRDDLRCGVREG